MDSSRPFTLYDFIGYFTPGALFLLIFYYFIKTTNNDLLAVLQSYDYHTLTCIVSMIIISYILGHMLNYLSSISIEKYAIWMYGKPCHFLLVGTPSLRSYFHKNKDNCTKVNSSLLDDNLKKIIHYQQGKFNAKKALWLSRAWRTVLFFVILPVSSLDCLIGRGLKLKLFYTNPASDIYANSIINKLSCLFKKLNIEFSTDIDIFKIVLTYYLNRSNVFKSRSDSCRAIYGFARTLSFVFSVISWFYIGLSIFGYIPFSVLILSLLLLSSYVFYMTFMKYYRRYAFEGFLYLLVDEEFSIN